MAEVKGLNIKLGADFSAVEKGVKNLAKDNKDLTTQLRAVNNGLKLDPKNVELLEKKQALLSKQIDGTKKSIDLQKKAQEELDTAFKNGVISQDQYNTKQAQLDTRLQNTTNALKIQQTEMANVNNELPSMAKKFDAAGDSIQNAGDKIKNSGVNVAKAGAIVTGAAAGLIVAGKKAIDSAFLQTRNEEKLTEILRTRTNATDDQIQSIKNLTSEQQALGVVGDEVQIAGAQQLATFVGQTSSVETLLPAMNNLLVQQKGLNATSEDATNIGNLFGKVLGGQVGALSKVGITFSEAQEKILKFGTEEEKAATLSEVVTSNVGNMNQALAATDEGQVVNLTNTLGDMQEEIGFALLPAVVELVKSFKENLLPIIQNMLQYLKDNPEIAKFAVMFTAVLAVLGPVLIFIGLLITAVGQIVTVFGGFVKLIPQIVSGMKGFLAPLKQSIIMIWQQVSALLAQAAAFIAANWPILLIIAAIGILIGLFIIFKDKIMEVAGAIWGWLVGAFEAVVNWFKSLGGKIAEAASVIWEFFKNLPKQIWDIFVAGLTLYFQIVAWFYGTIWEVLKTILNFFVNLGKLIWDTLVKGLIAYFNIVAWFYGKIGEVIVAIVSFFINLGKTIWDTFIAGLSAYFNLIGWFIEKLGEIMTFAINWAKDLGKNIWQGIKDGIKGIGSWVKGLFTGGSEAVSVGVNYEDNGIPTPQAFGFRSAFGIDTESLQGMAQRATQTIFNSTQAIPRTSSTSGASNYNTINITAADGMNERTLAKLVLKEIGRL